MPSLSSRTKHLLLSAYGGRWREVILAMFTVYVDDSGTAPDQRIAIATGLIVPAIQISRFDREWNALSEKEGFTDFHTSEFIARNHRSEFASWDESKQRRVFDRVKRITKKYGLKAGSIAVNKQEYESALPESFRRQVGGHYAWAVMHLLTLLRHQRKNGYPKCSGFEYVFDWAEEGSVERTEIEIGMGRSESIAIEEGNPGEFSNYSFRRRKDIPALQCVDCVSWVAYRFALFSYYQTPMHPLADAAWKDFEGPLGNNGWLGAVTLEKNKLEDWYREVQADPRNADKFERAERDRLVRMQRSGTLPYDANEKGKTAQ